MAPVAIAAALSPALGAAAAAKFGGAAAVLKVGGAAAAAKSGASAVLASSFLEAPAGALGKFLEPEVAAYNWAHDKLFGAHLSDVAGPDQARFVDYYAVSCPHCKHLDPDWKEAMTQWSADRRANKMVFQKRECLDANWKNGKDYEECNKAGVDAFPTIKFYKPGSNVGYDYDGDRDPKSMVNFARDVIDGKDVLPHPDPEAVGKEVKLVDYYAASCHHCKQLDPIFNEAKEQWANLPNKEIAQGVLWTKKECYDTNWKPGRDAEECQREHINAFPTVRLTAVNSATGAKIENIKDFKGKRTAEGLHQFIKETFGIDAKLEEPPMVQVAAESEATAHHASPEVAHAAEQEPVAASGGAEVAAGKAGDGGAEAAGAAGDAMKLPMPMIQAMPLSALASLSCLGPPKARKSPAKQMASREVPAAVPPRTVSSFI